MTTNTMVIGAGLAGLACARALAEAGKDVTVVDKARGVGGRCATRRMDGQPVDHGLPFLHGRDPAFVAALAQVEGALAWPRRIHGRGRPCHPDALDPDATRVAFEAGLTAFPKHLSRGLGVRLRTRVESLDLDARNIVLTAPAEQSRDLLATTGLPTRPVRSAHALLGMVGTVPCCSLIAVYTDADAPPFDILQPASGPLLLVSHDSSKRRDPAAVALVLQATPRWSREHLEEPPKEWADALLHAAAHLLGDWARTPDLAHPHRWRYARIDRGTELSRPLDLPLSEGRRLVLAGELFARGGGAEAAWRSGRHAARLLLETS